ncbi:proton-conducting transporter transmembrane domain-containing protein [Robertkochia flava]|uniref:proton-conducting transporter transmembrane domain-containing protein n=1 Tax=Robertkochia flava TaxID=3447986 RepID=UPI001CC92101|nr:proton-conducting transporter membrane subunit [Robertkochia marina]
MFKNSEANSRSTMHAKRSQGQTPLISNLTPILLWSLFALTAACSIYFYPDFPEWSWNNLVRVNGFTMLIWMTVTFFGALISTYAKRYLNGFLYEKRFMVLTLGFTATVMLLLVSNHLLLLVASWFLMGLNMSKLIGINAHWGEARAAGRSSQRYFMASSILLAAGLAIPAFQAKAYTLETLLKAVPALPTGIAMISALFILTAAIIQSAIFPFHRWLLSSMTAPTPASGLMHAGFVNGAGILLAILAPFVLEGKVFTLLFILGGLTAVIAQFAKLLQVTVKQRLACSTIAQMGFMIMQCGLGFFNAAVAHLILHGFYKAYLFLSAGEGIEQTHPKTPPQIRIKPHQTGFVLLSGIAGALLFILFTGKGSEVNSGIFLTLIVAIAVGQVTYNFIKQKSLPLAYRTIVPVVLFFGGIGLYALVYNGVTAFMADMPLAVAPQKLTPVQIGFGLVFLIGFFIMKLGIYQNHPWLYVKLLNLTQPLKNSVLKFKNTAL